MAGAVLISGLAIGGYRSFGATNPQHIGPLTKVHLLAGPNNSGKSNVLQVAATALPALRGQQNFSLGDIDVPIASAAEGRHFRIGLLLPVFAALDEIIEGTNLKHQEVRELFLGPTFAGEADDGVWIQFMPSEGKSPAWTTTPEQVADLASHADGQQRDKRLRRASNQLTGGSSDDPDKNAARALNRIVQRLTVQELIPPVSKIGAFRRITDAGPGNVVEDDYDGAGLIERLARLQNPSFDEPQNRERFGRINRFVQSLFDDPDAELDVPHDRKTLLIRYEDQWLPLENYGTGLHEVVVLAAASTVLSGHLVCIEEPEIHLHPTLQRKLLRYLAEVTDNQYLIATHSAHLLDSERASISAVRLDAGNTVVEAALKPVEVAAISSELGARASDLVQANCVIWVEGPSDRIYIRHWIEVLAPKLVEGIHYSLLFYGGRLLSHLSADDPAIDEFISLPRINRHFAIVIDSDRKKKGARITATKRRVKKEIESISGSEPWVTQGYTIENYVPPDVLRQAIGEVHPGTDCVWEGSQYQDPLGSSQIKNRESPVDKPAIAERVVARWNEVDPWPLDLVSQVRRLIELVRKANA